MKHPAKYFLKRALKMFFPLFYPIFGGVRLPLPLLNIMKTWKIRMGEGLRQFLLVYNLVLHVFGCLEVISMLRRKIMAVLLEGGSECIGNLVQNTKIWKCLHFASAWFNLLHIWTKLDIDAINDIWMFDVNMTSKFAKFTNLAEIRRLLCKYNAVELIY